MAPWEHIRIGEAPEWAETESWDVHAPKTEGAHVTHLLFSRQVHAPSGVTYCHSVQRLETAQAVQSQSQWNLSFDPRFQSVTLAALSVIRGTEQVDHRQRERMRLIQRENQLDRLVIDGAWTLLVVLDDVRPGDLVEAAFALETRHRLDPTWFEAFFAVPLGVCVDRYRFNVVFGAATGMRWKGAPDAPALKERLMDSGLTQWRWQGSQPLPRKAEVNIPSWHLDYVWIQISNVPSWAALARAVAFHWEAVEPAPVLLSEEWAAPATVDETAVARAIRSIQDGLRYLSVNLENSGLIPAAPSAVAERRYGDCKDLAWLAAVILRRWGVTARPILVGTRLRRAVDGLLPAAMLFDHAVLEVAINGSRRWFDLTMRNQGGEFATIAVRSYGLGLAVDSSGDGLVAQPGPLSPSTYVIRETIWLDARKGKTSTVEIGVRAEGIQADNLRGGRALKGAEDFATERQKHAERRFGKATRRGKLQWRDDRERNVCEVVEAFDFEAQLQGGGSQGRVVFEVPNPVMVGSFPIPDEKARRIPWDLPYPLELRQQTVVRNDALRAANVDRRRWETSAFLGLVENFRRENIWMKTSNLCFKQTEIPAAAVAEYRVQFLEFLNSSTWRLLLPPTSCATATPEALGALPDPADAQAYVPSQDPAGYMPAADAAALEARNAQKIVSSWRRMTAGRKRLLILFAIWFGLMLLSAMLNSMRN